MNTYAKKYAEPDGSIKSRQGFEIFSSMIPMQNPLSRQGQHTIMNTCAKKYVEPNGSNQLMGWSILLEIC
ncbi:MAG: hypothetical protein M0P47_11460 [Bacteroidales bacterium]|nr:hypothetical protein [Bacteroidales bacterium]